jgi:hypothetical protein
LKFVFVILVLVMCNSFLAQKDSIQWTRSFEKELGVDEAWTTDILGNLILTRRNVIEKYDSTGRLLFSQSIRSIGKISQLAPVNAMKLFVFSEEQQSLCVMDNTLSLSERCNDLADFDIGMAVHIAASGQSDRVWVLDQPNSRLLLVRLGRTATSQEIKNLNGILNIAEVSDISEYNNELYLTDYTRGVYRFDQYGSFIDFYPVEACDHLSVVNGTMLTLCSGELTLTELITGKKIVLQVPEEGVKAFRNLGNNFWFRTENKVINYRLSLNQ